MTIPESRSSTLCEPLSIPFQYGHTSIPCSDTADNQSLPTLYAWQTPVSSTLAHMSVSHDQSSTPADAPPTSSAATRLDSSAMSVLSASGTLVSREDRRHSRSTLLSSHAFSRHSTAHTLIRAQTELDSELFKPVFRELNGYQERFETLSDQVLGAMSVFDESSLGLNPILPVPPADEYFIPVERRRPTTTATGDLEEGRRFTAQSIADLVFAVWNRLQLPSDDVSYDVVSTPSSVAMESHTHTLASPIMMPPLHSQVQWTPKAIKQRIKLATQLKSAIVTFWSAQSHFQEKAQLILDIYQDPSEIETDDRLRALRSRHLHNLLACNLDPGNGERLAIKYREDQDKMAEITEQLQDVWLGLVMLLEKPVQTASSKAEVAQLGDSIGLHESFGHKLIRLGKNKRQAFKSLVKNW